MFSTAVYLPLQCSVPLYMFTYNVQSCCISSPTMFSTAVYLPLQCSVLLYIFPYNVQYCCITSPTVFSTAVYLPQQRYKLSYPTNLAALLLTPHNTNIYSVHANPPLDASIQSRVTSSPPGMFVGLFCTNRLHSPTSLRETHQAPPTQSLPTLILTLFYTDHLKTSRIHFSLLCQAITVPLQAARLSADHSNKLAAFAGR